MRELFAVLFPLISALWEEFKKLRFFWISSNSSKAM